MTLGKTRDRVVPGRRLYSDDDAVMCLGSEVLFFVDNLEKFLIPTMIELCVALRLGSVPVYLETPPMCRRRVIVAVIE